MPRSAPPRYFAGIVALAPAALLAALLYHPHLSGRLPDHAAIAAAVEGAPTQWGLAHIATAVASALIILAFLAVRAWLREADSDRNRAAARGGGPYGGREPWSAFGVPFVVLGSVFYAMLPGMEFAPLAAALGGQDAEVAQSVLGPWFLSMLLTGATLFAIGAVAFAVGIVRSGAMAPGVAWLVAVGLVVMAIARFVPVAEVQFHVHGTASLVALWPVAWAMRRAPAGTRAGTGRREEGVEEGAEPPAYA